MGEGKQGELKELFGSQGALGSGKNTRLAFSSPTGLADIWPPVGNQEQAIRKEGSTWAILPGRLAGE